MPKIDFDGMPFTKLESTGESVRRNAFYLPDEDAEESTDIYRGYHTIDTSNLTFNNPILLSRREDKRVVENFQLFQDMEEEEDE